MYTDPTGHEICDADGYCGTLYPMDHRPITPAPQLDLDDVEDPEQRNNPDPTNGYPDGYIKPAWENYQKIWHWLMTHGYRWAIEADGKINDIVLMTFIIYGEFGVFKLIGPDDYGNSAYTSYNAALGALSNQYNSPSGGGNIQCGGNGCTLAEQIGWLSDVTSWYNGRDYNALVKGTMNWEIYQVDAKNAAEGIDSNMWMWGNVGEPRSGDVAYYAPWEYKQWPWFVVHP